MTAEIERLKELLAKLGWVRCFVAGSGKVDYAETCEQTADAIEALIARIEEVEAALSLAANSLADAIAELGEYEQERSGESYNCPAYNAALQQIRTLLTPNQRGDNG